jgi:hypothetical protein
LNELLHQRAAQVLLAIEETTDPPISPIMVRKTEVRTLENAPAPEGIFDLPKDFKKLEAR